MEPKISLIQDFGSCSPARDRSFRMQQGATDAFFSFGGSPSKSFKQLLMASCVALRLVS